MLYAPHDVSRNPHFRYIENTWIPWTPVTRVLGHSRIALVTMGGFYMPASQRPFVDEDGWGDTTYRAIPAGTAAAELAIAHRNYDHAHAKTDLNCLFPLERLRAMAARGVIGSLADTHYSFMGSIPDPTLLLSDSAPAVASRMRSEGVDGAILSAA